MQLKKNKALVLSLIILAAALLRLFNLASLPAILNRDEAALAYNAYLLKETGRDEWQVKNPLLFKSFGDYKLPLYPYLLSGFFRILPPNDFTVRLPSALAGIFLVFLAYYFAKKIIKLKEDSSLFFALLIAILPIFSFYSRIAFEANLALSLFIASLYFLFKEKRQLFWSLLLMFLAVLTYNTPLLLLPFIILFLPINDGIANYKKYWPAVVSLSLLFVLVFLRLYPLTAQKSAITIFSDSTVWEEYAIYRAKFSGLAQTIFGNQYIYYLKIILKNLIASFSLRFLVIGGGSHPWHSIANWGHLFYSVYLLGILGTINLMIKFFKKNKKTEQKIINCLLYFLLVSLSPAIVTVDSPHATRSLFFFFIFALIAVNFIEEAQRFFKKIKLAPLFLIVLLVESLFYYRQYFLDYPQDQPSSLWVEYPQLIRAAEAESSQQPIAVIDGGGFQYILTAWYLKTPATDFFATMKFQAADSINFYYGEKLTHYHFIKNELDLATSEKMIISPTEGLKKL